MLTYEELLAEIRQHPIEEQLSIIAFLAASIKAEISGEQTTQPKPATNNQYQSTLRLVWPQWQGAGVEAVRELFTEIPFEEARRGYSVGTAVLNAVLPAHTGPTAFVPVELGDFGLTKQDGIEAKEVVVKQLASALEIIGRHNPQRILTLGGECSVSVAPFSWLAGHYGDDLAILWIDANPDVDTPANQYGGYHAMAVSILTGHGDAEVLGLLPATIDASRVALAGVHAWAEDPFPNIAGFGIKLFSPDDLHRSSQPLLDWLKTTGCSKVAIHFDVDVVDSNEIVLGLGMDPDGLLTTEVQRLVEDISAVADVVGLTVAEYIPRQVIRLQRVLRNFPLIKNP